MLLLLFLSSKILFAPFRSFVIFLFSILINTSENYAFPITVSVLFDRAFISCRSESKVNFSVVTNTRVNMAAYILLKVFFCSKLMWGKWVGDKPVRGRVWRSCTRNCHAAQVCAHVHTVQAFLLHIHRTAAQSWIHQTSNLFSSTLFR